MRGQFQEQPSTIIAVTLTHCLILCSANLISSRSISLQSAVGNLNLPEVTILIKAFIVGLAFHISAPSFCGDLPHRIRAIMVARHHKPGHASLEKRERKSIMNTNEGVKIIAINYPWATYFGISMLVFVFGIRGLYSVSL